MTQEVTVSYNTVEKIAPQLVTSLQSIAKQSFVDYNRFTYVGLVSTNNMNIGLVGLTVQENKVFVYILQSPAVCRLSILSLIDSSIVLLQAIVEDDYEVVFTNVNYAHTFKLQQIIDDIQLIGTDDYSTSGSKVLSIDMSKITLKRIILEKM